MYCTVLFCTVCQMFICCISSKPCWDIGIESTYLLMKFQDPSMHGLKVTGGIRRAVAGQRSSPESCLTNKIKMHLMKKKKTELKLTRV